MDNWILDTPVVFIVFKRLDTTKQVFERIRQAKPTKLYLISDGAREGIQDEQEKVDAVRQYIDCNIDWECEVSRDYSDKNMGSRYRIVSGLDAVFSREESAIILEDDVVPHDTFFRFCQDMLEYYKDDQRIGMITGCNMCAEYPSDEQYYFTSMVENWGWATWKRSWETYDSDVKQLEKIKREHYLENYYGKAYAKEIIGGLDMVVHNGLDAWDCQWVYNMAVNSQYSVMPAVNLVSNVGFNSNEATHTKEKCRFEFRQGEMEWPIQYSDQVRHEFQYDRYFIKKNYDIHKVKKLFLMIDSYITIHFRNKDK